MLGDLGKFQFPKVARTRMVEILFSGDEGD